MLSLVLVLGLLASLLAIAAMALREWPAAPQRRAAIAGVTAFGVVLGLVWLMAQRAPLDRWSAWEAGFERALAACGENEEGARCLARAYRARALPSPEGQGAAARFFHDLRVAERLLANERASDLLWREFGVDSNDFLGTGFSTPYHAEQAARSYRQAHQREYFVANICADAIDLELCPAADARVWTWRLTTAQARPWLDRPLSRLLAAQPPSNRPREWRNARARLRDSLEDEPAAYIRFARFNPQYYAGTVGRPGADLVFFAAYPDTADTTLRQALADTGSAALAEGDTEEVLFIWLYLPDEAPPRATWGAVYDYLAALPLE